MKFVIFLMLNQLKKCKMWGYKSKTWEMPACTHFQGYLFKLKLLMIYNLLWKSLNFLTSGLPERLKTWGLVLIMFSGSKCETRSKESSQWLKDYRSQKFVTKIRHKNPSQKSVTKIRHKNPSQKFVDHRHTLILF